VPTFPLAMELAAQQLIVFDYKDETCHCLPSVLLRIGVLVRTELSNIFIYYGVSQNDC
jgi:hypothetical protein